MNLESVRRGWLAGLLPLLGGCSPKGVDGWFVDVWGKVVDEDGVPVVGAALEVATPDGAPVGAATTDDQGFWHLPVYGTALVGNSLVAAVTADGLADARAVFDLNLRAPVTNLLGAGPWSTWQTTDRRVYTVHMAREATAGLASGTVLDATTGLPVAGLTLNVQHGANASIGDTVGTTVTTDTNGRFEFGGYPAGAYTVSMAESTSWAATRFPLFATEAGTTATGLVSAPVGLDELRASLSWQDPSRDLDLHFSAPLANGSAGEDGNGRYHVWSGEPTHPDDVPQGQDFECVMELVASAGPGPETVHMTGVPGPGALRPSVVDMSAGDDGASTGLSDSRAVVQVWYSEDLARYYEIDPAEPATWWNPVEIDDTTYVSYAIQAYASGVDPADPDAF